jgi:ADP-heptose:LPS heptosyltransferase
MAKKNGAKKAATTDEKLERLTGIVDALAATVVAHDNQIDKLIIVAEKHGKELAALRELVAATQRQWQAYLNRLPRQ